MPLHNVYIGADYGTSPSVSVLGIWLTREQLDSLEELERPSRSPEAVALHQEILALKDAFKRDNPNGVVRIALVDPPGRQHRMCTSCCARLAMHECYVDGKNLSICCYCYVAAGNPPADWHTDCMTASKSH